VFLTTGERGKRAPARKDESIGGRMSAQRPKAIQRATADWHSARERIETGVNGRLLFSPATIATQAAMRYQQSRGPNHLHISFFSLLFFARCLGVRISHTYLQRRHMRFAPFGRISGPIISPEPRLSRTMLLLA
jgi:hypothetical protein